MLVLVYLFLSLLVSQNESARILAVFPMASISHQVVFRPLVQGLAKRGHEVVVITTDPAFPKGEAPPNLTEIDVHDISYNIMKQRMAATSLADIHEFKDQLKIIMSIVFDVFDAQLSDQNVQDLINDKNQKFDLLFIEACMQPALIFSHIYKVPVILISSLGVASDNLEVIGAPTHLFLYPTSMQQKILNLTLWDKVSELYNRHIIETTIEEGVLLGKALFKKHFGNNVPTVAELNNNVHMLFLNINPIFEGIRPVPPTVIYMGGLHQNPEQKLPTVLQQYLDTSKNGVIYFSLGTNVDPTLFPPELIQGFVNVFSRLPYDVLWKWNNDELPGQTDNIKISKWLPQSDLLRHPKIKLFITQGGLQSTDEAITAGVPLVGIPVLADQFFNVQKYIYHKIGVGLALTTLTEEVFENAINTVINDNSYRKNIVNLRELMNDEPMKPLERAIWWTEYVLRHGGAKHLRSPTANISWAQYLELELVFTLLTIALGVIFAFVVSIYLLYGLALRIVFKPVKTDKKRV